MFAGNRSLLSELYCVYVTDQVDCGIP